MKNLGMAAILLAGGVLCGCAMPANTRSSAQRQAEYAASAGAPQNTFIFSSGLYSWEPLGETQLVVYTKPKEAYLIDLKACSNLLTTNSIGLTSRLGQVSVNFDSVRTRPPLISCAISQIRPIDIFRLKAAQQAQRKIDAEPREEKPVPKA